MCRLNPVNRLSCPRSSFRQAQVGGEFQGLQQCTGLVSRRQDIALTLSRDGGSQLYLMDANGGEPRRLGQSPSIDTEPTFTSNGRTLYFVSDRGGSPQIYRMPASGGNAERVTVTGTYNISPSLSPDGRWLAYVSRVNGAFKLHVMELATGVSNAITETTADENPSFSSTVDLSSMQPSNRPQSNTTTTLMEIKARLAVKMAIFANPTGVLHNDNQ